jgi:tetratricopeptide (TPR) repeat protein
VAGAGALLLTAVLALAAGVVLLGRTQRETDRQRRRAEQSAARALALQHQADESARTAREQRARALQTVQVLLDSQLGLPEDQDQPLNRELLLYLRRALLDKAVEELERMARRPETAAEANQYRARAHLAMGDTLVLAGKLDEARASYERGREIADEMERAAPRGEARWSLCLALQKIGGIDLENRHLAPAAQSLERALRIAEGMVREEGTNRRALINLRACSLQYGRVKLHQGDVPAALRAAEEALRVAGKLEEYAGPRVLPDKSVCYALLGDVRLRQDDLPKARAAYQAALKIDADYHRFNPGSDEARQNLARSHENVGDLDRRQGQEGQAYAHYTAAVRLQEKLAVVAPADARAQLALAEARAKLAKVELDPEKALAGFEQALQAWQRFEKQSRLKARERRAKLRELAAGVAECQVRVRIVSDLKYALKHARAAEMLVLRTRVLVRRGKLGEAAETAGKLAELPGERGAHHYSAACCFALCAAGACAGKAEDDLSDEEKEQRDGFVGKALAQLRQAASAGHFKAAERVAQLRLEPDLVAVRERAEFKALLKQLGARP